MPLRPAQTRLEAAPIDMVELGDGTRFPIPVPTLWPDNTNDLIEAGDFAAAAAGVLGEANYEAFKDDGGTAAMLFAHIGGKLGDGAGPVALGESSASDG